MATQTMLNMGKGLVACSLHVSKETWRHGQPLANPWECGSRKVCDISDFVVYTWATDHALTACQDGLAPTARLRMCIWGMFIVGDLSFGWHGWLTAGCVYMTNSP